MSSSNSGKSLRISDVQKDDNLPGGSKQDNLNNVDDDEAKSQPKLTYFCAKYFGVEDVDGVELQQDFFTLLFVYPLLSGASLFSFIVYVLQLTMLILALKILLNDADPDNLLTVPLQNIVDVNIYQNTALTVSIFRTKDIINDFDVFQI